MVERQISKAVLTVFPHGDGVLLIQEGQQAERGDGERFVLTKVQCERIVSALRAFVNLEG